MRTRAFVFAQVAAGDLDVGIVRQLPAPDFPLGDDFKPRPVQVIRLDTAGRGGTVRKQSLEGAARDPDGTVILADCDAELDGGSLRNPTRIMGEGKEDQGGLLRDDVRIMFSCCDEVVNRHLWRGRCARSARLRGRGMPARHSPSPVSIGRSQRPAIGMISATVTR